jgi:hypothetical protein
MWRIMVVFPKGVRSKVGGGERTSRCFTPRQQTIILQTGLLVSYYARGFKSKGQEGFRDSVWDKEALSIKGMVGLVQPQRGCE